MHISDIHCGMSSGKSPKYRLERDEAIEAFHRDFDKIPDDWKPDIIAITGDLGWSGHSDDYVEFNKFLENLLAETKLTTESVICCPGNHDKYLPKAHKFPATIKGVSKYHSINDVWNNLKPLAKNFNYFSKNLKALGIEPLCNNSGVESTRYLYGYRIIKGIYFIVLNSAWLCDWREDSILPEADKGKLLIDINIICEILGNGLPHLPVIAMYHHPKEWLKSSELSCTDDDRPTTVDRIYTKANIILNGHTHTPRENLSRRWLQYTAGTISSDDTYKSQCFLLRIHINKEDPKLSTVEEGQYYANWVDRKVSWFFRGDSGPKPFDIEKQLDILTEESNKKDKEIQELKEALAKQINSDKRLKKAYEKFDGYIDELQKEYNRKSKQLVKIQSRIEKMKAQMQEQTSHQAKILRLLEDSESILQTMISVLEISQSEIKSLIANLWKSAIGDTLSDVEKKEHSKRLIKTPSFITQSPIDSENI